MGAGTVALDAAKAAGQWVAKNPGKAVAGTGVVLAGTGYAVHEGKELVKEVGNSALKVGVGFGVAYAVVQWLKRK